MKARKVKGLDPAAPFAENAHKIITVRRDELAKLGERSLDARRVKDLHDARIATKRLRYLYEIAEPSIGHEAKAGAKRMKVLQDLLGEIHDCDEMSERIRADAASVPTADRRYVGLEALATYFEAKRRVLHREFVRIWPEMKP